MIVCGEDLGGTGEKLVELQHNSQEMGMCYVFVFLFPSYAILNIACLKILPYKCEMCDMCVLGACVGKSCRERSYRDRDICNVILTNEKLISGNEPIRKVFCVMCAVGATMAGKPQNFVGC